MSISIEIVILYVSVSILFIILSGVIGSSYAIRNDLKSLYYDVLERENEELKETINKMIEVKNEKEYEDNE